MVHCAVVNCSDRSPRDTRKGISFHRFLLKDETRLSEWLAQIKREHMPPLADSHLCSAYFESSCFEEDLQSKLMPESGRKRNLKDDAIPTLLAHKKRFNVIDKWSIILHLCLNRTDYKSNFGE